MKGLKFVLARGACGRGGRFLKKAPQKPFEKGVAIPPTLCNYLTNTFPHALDRALSKSFSDDSFRLRKESSGSREIRAKESVLSFARISLGLEEKPKLLLKK